MGITKANNKTAVATLGITTIAIILVVLSIMLPSSQAAFTAKVANGTNTAGTRSAFTCEGALLGMSDKYAALFGYLMKSVPTIRREPAVPPFTPTPSGTNDLVYINYGIIGTPPPAPASTSGCVRDSPQTAVTFNAANKNCTYADVYWGYTAANLITIGAWFRSPAPTTALPANGSGPIVGFNGSKPTATTLGGKHDRMLYIDNAGRMVFGVYSAGTHKVSSPAGTDYRDGKWHHVAASLSSAGMVLYMDGTKVGSLATVTAGDPYNGYWLIGCQNLAAWTTASGAAWSHSGYYTGDLQYAFGIYGALSETDVKSMWLAGRP